MIYLDNSATTMYKPQVVIDSVAAYLRMPGNPGRGVNQASLQSGSIVYETRERIAEFFHFDKSSNVCFTSNITESSNTIINALIGPKDHAITTYLDHNATLRPLYHSGCEISLTDGTPQQVEAAIKPNTKAVFINHASNVTGEVQDIKAIGDICKKHDLLYIVDCAQSAGILDIDILDCNISILNFTGHKALMGIQGIGGTLINTDVYIDPLKRGGTGIHSFDHDMPAHYPEHLEAGSINVPGIVSLYASIGYINEFGLENIYKNEINLRNKLLDYFSTKPNVTVYKNDEKPAIGVVTFNYDGIDSAKISDYLSNEHDIAIRAGAHCAPLALEHYGIESCARVSFGIKNTEEDVDVLIKALDQI